MGHLDFRTFTTKDNYVSISDEIAFNPVHVDHSIPASYGFLIYIGGRKIAYTGDFRMHGRKSYLTEDSLDELKNNDVDVLICEGTNLSDSSEAQINIEHPRMIDHGCRTEEEVESEVRKVAEDSEDW